MKKQFLKLTAASVLLGSMLLSGCSKDDDSANNGTTPVAIEQKNRALVIDITGTWCPPCGAYGIPGFNDAISKGKDKMVPFAIHISDPLTVPAMNTVSSLGRFMTSSVPRIVAGNGLVFPAGVYTDIGLTGDKIVEAVDTFIANNPVTAGVTITNLKVENGNISADVHTKFFNTAASGEYQLAVYFYENGVIQTQKMSGAPDNPDQQHDHTIRAVATSSAWGDAIPITGDVTSKNYSVPMNAAWKSANMGAIAVIWKKNGADYLYVNGNIK